MQYTWPLLGEENPQYFKCIRITRIAGLLGCWNNKDKTQICLLNHSPKETHGTHVHLGVILPQSPVQGTSYHCHSPGWSLLRPSVPWRRHSSGKGSYSGGMWTGTDYLEIRVSIVLYSDEEATATGSIYCYLNWGQEEWKREREILLKTIIKSFKYQLYKLQIYN